MSYIDPNPLARDWIRVDHDMPDADTTVIICTSSNEVDAGYFDGEQWLWASCDMPVDHPVTHWRDFPSHPPR